MQPMTTNQGGVTNLAREGDQEMQCRGVSC